MIILNGSQYSKDPKKIVRSFSCTRAEYNALGVYESNALYEVTELDGSVSHFLGGNLIGLDKSFLSFPDLGEVTLLASKYRSGTVGIKWQDPSDVMEGGAVIVGWKSTVVVRKEGSYPNSPEDGVIVVQENMRDSYVSNYLFDTGLSDGTTYYYSIFTKSNYNTWSDGINFNITPNAVSTDAPTDLVLVGKNGFFIASWENPSEVEETNTILGFGIKNIILVYNTDHIPTSVNDGESIILSKKIKTYTVENITNEINYYVSVFALSSDGGYSSPATGVVQGAAYQVMTVRIDETNSNPETALTYMDDAVGMTSGSEDWDEWFGCYPVILATGGIEYKKLNKNDYTKFEDGTDASSYLSNGEYDVMTAFPILGYKINREGNYLYVSMTDNPNAEDNGFVYYAHTKGTDKKDKFYLGAYDAYAYFDSSPKLYSWSGQTPRTSTTLTLVRNFATARGTGYQLMAFYQWTFLQCLFILKYKSLNCQTALGRGYVDKSSNGSAAQTGLTNAKGFNYGLTTSGTDATNNRVKFLGIEDCWGNILQWLDGCYSNSSRHLLTTKTNSEWNDDGSGYIDSGTMGNSSGAYINKVLSTNDGGFAPVSASGSSSTYYTDYCFVNTDKCVLVGGAWNYADYAGVFYFDAYSAASVSDSSIGCRICYL